MCSLSHVHLFAIPWDPPSSLSVEFPRQEYWSGLPFPPPGNLLNPEAEPKSLASPTLPGGFFTTGATWKPSGRFSDSFPLLHYNIITLLQDTDYSSLCYTIGPCLLSILYIVLYIC